MPAHLFRGLLVIILSAVAAGSAACSLLADEALADKPSEVTADGGRDAAGTGGAGPGVAKPGPTATSASLVCPPGLGDCDGDPANGCETDLDSSQEDCGACGEICPDGVKCDDGICEK